MKMLKKKNLKMNQYMMRNCPIELRKVSLKTLYNLSMQTWFQKMFKQSISKAMSLIGFKD